MQRRSSLRGPEADRSPSYLDVRHGPGAVVRRGKKLREAAVDNYFRAEHVAGCIAGQEQDRSSDLVGSEVACPAPRPLWPLKADVEVAASDVCYGPIGDIARSQQGCAYSITSSARARKVSGMVIPNAVAVFSSRIMVGFLDLKAQPRCKPPQTWR